MAESTHDLSGKAHAATVGAQRHSVVGDYHKEALRHSEEAVKASEQLHKPSGSVFQERYKPTGEMATTDSKTNDSLGRGEKHRAIARLHEASRVAHVNAAQSVPHHGDKKDSYSGHMAAARAQELAHNAHFKEAIRLLAPLDMDDKGPTERRIIAPTGIVDDNISTIRNDGPRAPVDDRLPWEKQFRLLRDRIQEVFGVAA